MVPSVERQYKTKSPATLKICAVEAHLLPRQPFPVPNKKWSRESRTDLSDAAQKNKTRVSLLCRTVRITDKSLAHPTCPEQRAPSTSHCVHLLVHGSFASSVDERCPLVSRYDVPYIACPAFLDHNGCATSSSEGLCLR